MKQDNTLSFRGKALTFVLALAMVFSAFGLIPDVSLTAYAEDPYASIKNTTTVVHFDGKDWYLIDYDNTTVTLLTKDSVGTSTFGSNIKYDESTVKTFVNNWYNENITAAKKEAVSGNEMFLLNAQQVNNIAENVRKCNTSTGSWWTRSGGTNNTVLSVNGNDGYFDDYDGDYLCSQTLDVRPALKLNLEKVDFISESKRFKLKDEGHYVAITPGNNMTKTSDSGDETQNDISGAIKDVVYNADEGYYFPEDYSIAEVSGVKVTRDSYTQITVSGTPTNDALITLTDPTAKTTPAAPTTAVSKNCTKLDNNDGKLTGVTTEMEYKRSDDTDWIPGTGNDITGLESGTYYVRLKETDTTLPSENQELTIKKFVAYTVIFKVVNGSWNDETDAAKTATVEGYEGEEIRLRTSDIPAVGSKPNKGYKAGSWDIEPTITTAITEDTTYTYTYDSKGEQTIVAEDVTATYGDNDKKVTASVSDPTTDAGAISYAVKKGSEDYIGVDASDGSLTIKKVPADGKAYVIVTAAGTDDYREATKEVTVTIAHKITEVAEVPATCEKDGVEKHWKDEEGTLYKDAEGKETVTETDLVIKALGHKYGTWDKLDDIQHQRVCEHDATHVEKANHTWDSSKVTKEATCSEKGERIYTCTVCEATRTEEVDVKHHNWGAPSYAWSTDNKTVTATRICKDNQNHKETETATVTAKVTKKASYTAKGQTTYTATFKNSAFKTQTKVLTNIAKLPKKANTITVKAKKPTVKFAELKKKGKW